MNNNVILKENSEVWVPDLGNGTYKNPILYENKSTL